MSQPHFVLGIRHVYCTGQLRAFKYHISAAPTLSTATPEHRHQGRTPSPPPGYIGTTRDTQHCGVEQSGTRHGIAGALTLELAAASNQGQVTSSTQALMSQGRGEGTRTGIGLFFWSYSEGNGPQAKGPDAGTWGNSFGNTGMGLQPQVVMQAAVSPFNNSEKQHKPSQEQKSPTAARSRGAGHADRGQQGWAQGYNSL